MVTLILFLALLSSMNFFGYISPVTAVVIGSCAVGVWYFKSKQPPKKMKFVSQEQETRYSHIAKIEKWFEDNRPETKEGLAWKKEICELLEINEAANVERSFLVVINPKSGVEKSVTNFRQIIRPLLKIFGFRRFNVIETKHAGHAIEIIEKYDLKTVDAILCIGGDGTINEIVRGFLRRDDCDATLSSIPIGIIPGGSGNMTSACINELHPTSELAFATKAEYISAALRVAAWRSMPLTILETECIDDDGKKLHAYGSVCVSFGDGQRSVDRFDTFRKLGLMASTSWIIVLLWNMITFDTFEWEMKYLPADADEEAPDFKKWKISENWKTVNQSYRNLIVWSLYRLRTAERAKQSVGQQIAYLFYTEADKFPKRGPFLQNIISKFQTFSPFDSDDNPDGCHFIPIKAYEITGSSDTPTWKRTVLLDGEVERDFYVKSARVKFVDIPGRVFA